jgi:hypothetical protein
MLSLKDRINSRKIPMKLLAELASQGGGAVFATEASQWSKGAPLAAHKCQRLLAALEAVENLVDSVVIPPDLRDTAVVRAAIGRLSELQTVKASEPPAPAAIAAVASSEQTEAAQLLAADENPRSELVAKRAAEKQERQRVSEIATPILSSK